MMPVEHDLYCYRGQSWKQSLYFEIGDQSLDLSGMIVKAQIRPVENSPILTAEMRCVTQEKAGKITLSLSSRETSAIAPGVYCYDVRLEDMDGEVTYYIFGKFIVKGCVRKQWIICRSYRCASSILR